MTRHPGRAGCLVWELASQAGCKLHATHPAPKRAAPKEMSGKINQSRIPSLCSTTGFSALLRRSSQAVVVAICCKLLQARVDRRNCCRRFTNGCNLLQSAKKPLFRSPFLFSLAAVSGKLLSGCERGGCAWCRRPGGSGRDSRRRGGDTRAGRFPEAVSHCRRRFRRSVRRTA